MSGIAVVEGKEYWNGRRTPEELSDASLMAGDGVRDAIAIVSNAVYMEGEGVLVWSAFHCCVVSDGGSWLEAATGKGQLPRSAFRRSHMVGVREDGLVSLRYLTCTSLMSSRLRLLLMRR